VNLLIYFQKAGFEPFSAVPQQSFAFKRSPVPFPGPAVAGIPLFGVFFPLLYRKTYIIKM
jgi:hypothetical protein